MADALSIGLLTHSVHPRGGVVHTLELAQALHEAGHAVRVFVPTQPGQRLFRSVPFAIESIAVAPAGSVAAMVETRIAAVREHLAARRGDNRFDVLHAQDPIGGNALADLVALGRIGGFVRTVHHLDPFDDPRLAARQDRGFRAASRVLCVSAVWRERLRREHGVDAAIVPNGVDLRRYHRQASPADAATLAGLGVRAGAAQGEPVFLALGGIEARKNTLRLLEAFLRVRHSLPAAQLVIAGGASLLNHDAYAAEFHRAVAAAGLACGPGEPLLLTGPLPDDAMPALLRRADVLAMPSLREGFGLVVLEALACGTPVAVSKIAPFTEYLGDAEAAWAEPTDVDSIANALREALAPARAAALARAVPAVCARFDWAASAERHVALYRAFIGAQRTPVEEGAAACR